MAPHTFITQDGLRIAYYVDDFSDPWLQPRHLVLLHSAMGHSGRFYAMVPPLARRFRVVRMDLRGHGRSEVPPIDSPLSMERLVADVTELLDHLGAEKAHFVGNSAGGYVAQNLAMAAPHRVQTLSLCGSTPGLKRSQAASWLPRVARDGLRKFLADTIADRFPLNETDPRQIEWFLDEAAKNDVAFIARFIGLMTTLDWSEELHRIKCPTLLLVPGDETVGSGQQYELMQQRIAGAKLVSLPGLPHNICDSAPERCAEAILAFIADRAGQE